MASVEFVNEANHRVGDTAIRWAVMARDDTGAAQDSVAIPGLTVGISIQRLSDGRWFNGGVWVVGKLSILMTEVNPADNEGLFESVYTYAALVPGGGEETLRVEAISAGHAGTPGNPAAWQLTRIQHHLFTTPVDDTNVSTPLADFGEVVRVQRAMISNDQDLDDATKQWIIYKDDGVTPLVTFDVKDAAGNASIREVFKRDRA